MSIIVINTNTLRNTVTNLNREQSYYNSKKSIFTSSSFNASGLLSSYLNKINTIYTNISNNIKNTKEYLTIT